jgi:hypothetical protein
MMNRVLKSRRVRTKEGTLSFLRAKSTPCHPRERTRRRAQAIIKKERQARKRTCQISVPQKSEGRKRRKVKSPSRPARASSLSQATRKRRQSSNTRAREDTNAVQLWRKLIENARAKEAGTCQGKPIPPFFKPWEVKASSPEESA